MIDVAYGLPEGQMPEHSLAEPLLPDDDFIDVERAADTRNQLAEAERRAFYLFVSGQLALDVLQYEIDYRSGVRSHTGGREFIPLRVQITRDAVLIMRLGRDPEVAIILFGIPGRVGQPGELIGHVIVAVNKTSDVKKLAAGFAINDHDGIIKF